MTEFSAAEIQKRARPILSDFSLLEKEVPTLIGQEKLLRENACDPCRRGHLLWKISGTRQKLLLRTLAEAIGENFPGSIYTRSDSCRPDGTKIIVPRDGILDLNSEKGRLYESSLGRRINRARRNPVGTPRGDGRECRNPGGVRHRSKGFFFVMATQNRSKWREPSLPEAQA